MPTRVLTIAVEHYPQSTTTSQILPGSIANAEKFIAWTESKLSVKPEHITFCCSGESKWRSQGTTKGEIKRAILKLLQVGTNDTEKLLVFITGHGVMTASKGSEPHKDYLLCSDFENSSVSGDCIIDISDVTTLLSRCLGVGTHIYLIDACRTVDPVLNPDGLGVAYNNASSGAASWYQVLSATEGASASTDSRFVDRIVSALNGECDLEKDPTHDGQYWITFRKLAEAVQRDFESRQRAIEVRSVAEKADVRIRSIEVSGVAPSITDMHGEKGPPVDLLRSYDDIILLGETNGQLPDFVKLAAEVRQGRPWLRVEILSIEDLSNAGRPGVSLAELEQERQAMEEYVSENAHRIAGQVSLRRYAYMGTYGSFWTKVSGQRHAHVSSKVTGLNIRFSPSSDFVDFPQNPHPTVDSLFNVANEAIKGSRLVFHFPKAEYHA